MNYQDVFDTPLEEGQSVIATLDHTGDTKIIWSRNNATEVEIARTAFATARSRGFMAYSVTGKDGARGTVLAEFDQNAERIILAPPLQGGW